MKFKITSLLLAAAALLVPACEQHKWSETQKLFKEGEHHEAKGDEAKAAGHEGAKAPEHGAEKK